MSDSSNGCNGNQDSTTSAPGQADLMNAKSRRDFVVRVLGAAGSLGAGLFFSGCRSTGSARRLPLPPWDAAPGANSDQRVVSGATRPTDPPGYIGGPGVRSTTRKIPAGNPHGSIQRVTWNAKAPIMSEINPMLPIQSITVHHDAMEMNATSRAAASERIGLIQTVHQRDRRWADIGYHFIVDPGGRVWQGRSLEFQGAHVSNHNEGNIGVMCMGNFEVQRPTSAQLVALEKHVKVLMTSYRVPVERVRTHREWETASTLCPGRSLQTAMDSMRSRRLRA